MTEGERITRLETEMNHVATKADVAAVRATIDAVRTDIANMQSILIKWMTAMALGIVLSIGLGVADLLFALFSS